MPNKKKSTKIIKIRGGGKRGRPPVRYRRPTPKNMSRVEVRRRKGSRFRTGMILEFSYGKKQKPGEVGGWKTDPKPRLLVFFDDKETYIEGINTNYLSDYYLRKLSMIINKYPGLVSGEGGDAMDSTHARRFYKIIKLTAPFAIKKGYRKYLRDSIIQPVVFMYDDEIANEISPFAADSEDYEEHKGE